MHSRPNLSLRRKEKITFFGLGERYSKSRFPIIDCCARMLRWNFPVAPESDTNTEGHRPKCPPPQIGSSEGGVHPGLHKLQTTSTLTHHRVDRAGNGVFMRDASLPKPPAPHGGKQGVSSPTQTKGRKSKSTRPPLPARGCPARKADVWFSHMNFYLRLFLPYEPLSVSGSLWSKI